MQSPRAQFMLMLGISTLVSIGLFGYGALRNHSLVFDYLAWNLLLAWVPLLLSIRLIAVLRTKRWSSWEAMIVSVLWVIFLPNSFYMISDFIHLQEIRRVYLLYDVLMFTSFIYTGVVLGFSSLYLVHLQFRRRFSNDTVLAAIAAILVVCSSAIYIGRDLRWNSWDIITNPAGLLFDVSDRLTHPAAYPQMLVTVIGFLILLSTMYGLLWHGARLLQQIKN